MSKLVDKERLAKLAKALDDRMKATVQTEKERAMLAEQKNATDIATEKTRAEGKEGELSQAIANEKSRAEGKEGELAQAIADEASRADAAEKANKKAIEDEVARATGKENEIAGNLAKEVTDREAAVGEVQGNLDDFEDQYALDKAAQAQKDSDQDKAISDEVTRAKDAEKANADAIAQEVTDRQTAVQAVQDALNEFIGEDANGESVAEQMADMKADMEAADEALQDNIDAEAQTARAAEQALDGRLDVIEGEGEGSIKKAVADEAALRIAADEALQGAIDDIEADLVVIKGADTVEGSIAKAEKDAKDYADQKIAALVDSAPDAMNTLNELAEAINTNKGVYDAYVEQHATAMTKMKTDLQAEIDADVLVEANRAKGVEADLDQAIKDEASRADTAEKKIAGDLTKAVTDLQAEIDADVLVETNARKEADQALQNAIDAINNGTSGVLATAKKYADDQDAVLKAALQAEIDADVKVEADRAKAEEVDIRADFAAADTQLKTDLQAEIDADVKVEKERAMAAEGELDAAIEAEVTRAKAAEKANADAIAILNGNDQVVGSVDKKLADALASYTDTEDMMAILGQVVNSLAVSMENDKLMLKLGGIDGVTIHETSLDMATDADIDAIIAGLDAE